MAPAGFGNRVEGIHAVAAAAEAGRINKLTVEKGRIGREEVRHIVSLISDSVISVIDDVRDMAETESPQGVLADCDPILPVALDTLATSDAAVLVLDHIEDPQNLGAIARSGVAAGATGLVMSSRRAAPLSASAFKAAAGALERLPVSIVGSVPEALSRLKSRGVWTVGLDAGADESLFGLGILTEPVAVVIGAEGSGLSQLAAKRCDVLASIPMAGSTESLNASVSAALAAFEIARVRSGRQAE